MVTENVLRFDFGRLGKASRTGAGALRVPASLTRTGVFEYQTPEGPRREYRPPEEVFAPESVASANGVPVTILHPDNMVVDSENVSDLRHGFVVDGVSVDGDHVVGTIQLDTKLIQNEVDRGKLSEISMGYRCDMDHTPGVTPEGKPYDIVQRNIRYNHAALGPTVWGRMGRDIRLHVDSADVVVTGIRLDSEGRIVPPQKEKQTMKIRIDGMEFEIGSPEHIAYLENQIKVLTERAEKAEGAAAGATKQADEATAEVAKANDPEVVDAKVEERIDTINHARQIIGDSYDHKGKSNRQIRIDTLTHLDSTFKADSSTSDAFISGAFSVAKVRVPAKRVDTWTKPEPTPDRKTETKTDAKEPLWKRPLAASKQK